jgi:isoquinoline 1-oxidoreductase subunit beta
MNMTILETDRREFLKTTAKGSVALILGFYFPVRGSGQDIADSRIFRPNAWIRITPDNQITVLTEIPEMGQGPRTVDTMMLAEELEADWTTIRVEQAPVIPETYQNLKTGGSGGTGTAWGYMRKVGAQAREMLLTAAAQNWGVEKKDCRAENNTVVHAPSGRRVKYGELVATASKLPVPKADAVVLKSPAEFRVIGKSMPRVDVPNKVDGSAGFGIDVRVPGMLFAVVARCPHFGGKLRQSCPGCSRRFSDCAPRLSSEARTQHQHGRWGGHSSRLDMVCYSGPQGVEGLLEQGIKWTRDNRSPQQPA